MRDEIEMHLRYKMIELRTRAQEWNEAVIQTIPLEVAMPFYLMINAVEFADEARFDDDFVTYGFSPSRVLYWMGMTPKAEDDKSLIRDI